jgi:hypothetical protein
MTQERFGRLQAAIDNDHLIFAAVQGGGNGDQGQWHGPKDGAGVVENDFMGHERPGLSYENRVKRFESWKV